MEVVKIWFQIVYIILIFLGLLVFFFIIFYLIKLFINRNRNINNTDDIV